jgi:cyclophilin family peptidyl-prolyl cis-trans isomerase
MVVARLRIIVALFVGLLSFGDHALGATATHRARMYFNVYSVDIDLYGNESPLHVANFLSYVDDRAFDRTWIHRSFCCGDLYFLQGGDIYLPEPGDGDPPDLHHVEEGSAIPNEYDPNNGLTNSPGTLAAARQAGLDTARNGWFINSSDNSVEFPYYTVFGQVTRGLDVIQFISTLPIGNSYLSSYGYDTAPVFNNNYVFLYQVVERSLLDGDFDMDNMVGLSDLAMWEEDFGRMIISGPDFNGDKEIDSGDLVNWESGYGQFNGVSTFADFDDGDANRDGVVDGLDFLSWQRSSGKTTDVSADADGDYVVSGVDFLAWQRNYGAQVPPPIAAVPEPETLVLLLLSILARPYALRRARRA